MIKGLRGWFEAHDPSCGRQFRHYKTGEANVRPDIKTGSDVAALDDAA
jgi:hypothetical protein